MSEEDHRKAVTALSSMIQDWWLHERDPDRSSPQAEADTTGG